MNRFLDATLAGLGLAIGSPALAVAAAAIKLDDGGPVLYRQRRVGLDGEEFELLKLRTMEVGAEHKGAGYAVNDGDPRITRAGRFLRRLSIDEIPQLWNVIRGTMSLVGPRPALPHETEDWDALLTQRLRVKPGITGMWQVNGRSDTSFEDYTRLDLYYVDNWSLLTDLAILMKTVPTVLARRGAF